MGKDLDSTVNFSSEHLTKIIWPRKSGGNWTQLCLGKCTPWPGWSHHRHGL